MANQFSNPVTTGQNHYDQSSLAALRSRVKTMPQLPSGKMVKSETYSHGLQSIGKSWAADDSARKGSDSTESMQQHVTASAAPVLSDPESVFLTDSEDSEDEQKSEQLMNSSLRLSCSLVRASLNKGPREKRKVGRPIAYRGDPNSPELTEQERRRIKRRIANRESARRVRHKRLEMLNELQVKIDVLQNQNDELAAQVAESKHEKESLTIQLQNVTTQLKESISSNQHMQLELEHLRSSLQLRMSALEHALDRQLECSQEDRSVFASPQVQSSAAGYCPQPSYRFPTQEDFKSTESFQLALQCLPSFQLGEQSCELLQSEAPESLLP